MTLIAVNNQGILDDTWQYLGSRKPRIADNIPYCEHCGEHIRQRIHCVRSNISNDLMYICEECLGDITIIF